MRRRGSLAPTVAPNMARSLTLIMLPVMIKLKMRMMAIIKRIVLPYFENGRKIWQNLKKKKKIHHDFRRGSLFSVQPKRDSVTGDEDEVTLRES